MSGASLPRLMLVTDRRQTRGRDLVPIVVAAAQGGVGLVQVRERDLSDVELRGLVHELREALPAGVRLLVNTSLRVARTAAVGLHLPAAAPAQPPGVAAALPLVGRSAHDLEEARAGASEGVSYLVLGTIFPTPSKPGHPGGGVPLVERVCRAVAPVPVFAIGGITPARVPHLLHAGAHGVAVCGSILGANHPRRVAESLRLALDVSRPGG